MQDRVNKLRSLFVDQGLDGYYITSPENRYYLSGFTGSSGALLVGREKAYLITDFRYTSQAEQQCKGYDIVETKANDYTALNNLCHDEQIRRLGCEGDNLTYTAFMALQKELAGVVLQPEAGFIEVLRMHKDAHELSCIEEAVRIADLAFAGIISRIKPGVTEAQIALELEYTIRRLGAEGIGFDTIVASGIRSSMPHGVASDKAIEPGDLVTMDFGAVYRGYHSDMTRTVVVNQVSPRQQELYAIVLEAQQSGIEAVKAGVRASDVDRVARDVISKKGYGAYFGHGTGHGLGLSIHEKPSLSARDDTILTAGMVVTIEPGIYLPEWGGIRIEDTVIVEDEGSRILTTSPKEKLLIL
jgi:Xaa-Pro aminopeptidase